MQFISVVIEAPFTGFGFVGELFGLGDLRFLDQSSLQISSKIFTYW